ncbi:MAG: metallophosphoesterase [Armatimonadetes bacterium]|nr:metallophosphoesterase [Armatimonadota bacterium]
MRLPILLVSGAIAIGIGAAFVQQGGRGGPPPVFRTEYPASKLNVIAGAPTTSSITLSVLASTAGTATLTYGADKQPPKTQTVTLKEGVPLPVRLTKLQASARYRYDLQMGEEKLSGEFQTARKASEPFTFVFQADSHLDGNTDTQVYERTLRNIVKDRPDFLVDLGDTFMVDKYPKPEDALKQYQAQRYWFSIPGQAMSVFLCLGNHDGEVGWRGRGGISSTEWSQAQREANFPVISPDDFYSGAPRRGLYYSWKWGDATFIVLDPFVATTTKTRSDEDGWNWTLGETQFRWFEKVLKTSNSKYKFIFIHHLVGGFGREARGGVEASDKFEWGNKVDFSKQRSGWAEPIHELMVKYGVTALFHGHDHLYVRQERDGITYLEVPQPSASRGNTNSAEGYGYKSGKLLGSSGHIRVTVGPERAKLEYVKSLPVSANGSIADSFELKGR